MGFECDYHCRGKIIEKEFGKFKVYFADQSQFPSVSEAELKAMDEEIESLEESVKSLQGEVGMLRNRLYCIVH